MKTLITHIGNGLGQLREKPHHVRKRIALGAAAIGSGIIAVVWLAGNLLTGTFAIQGTNFAMSIGQGAAPATESNAPAATGLAGAAAVLNDTNTPAHIEVVDVLPPAPKQQPEKTVLPF